MYENLIGENIGNQEHQVFKQFSSIISTPKNIEKNI